MSEESEYKQKLTYHPLKDIWSLEAGREVVQVRRLTNKIKKKSLNEEYDDILNDYRPETDEVTWEPRQNPEYLVQTRACENSQDERLPAGLYRFKKDMSGRVSIEKMTFPQQDKYVERGYSERIYDELTMFFQNREKYEQMDISHRRGSLLYGPPGTGKSYSILRALSRCMDKYNLLVFYISKRFYGFTNLQNYGERFRDRNTVFLLEELTNHLDLTENSLLAFLDGELSWNHHYTLATTNYPNELSANLVDRPGRFDQVIEFPLPDRSFRKRFLRSYFGEEQVNENVIDLTEGYSVSYLRELVLRAQVFGDSIEQIIDTFQQKKQLVEGEFRDSQDLAGF